jgi:hypothetical protein
MNAPAVAGVPRFYPQLHAPARKQSSMPRRLLACCLIAGLLAGCATPKPAPPEPPEEAPPIEAPVPPTVTRGAFTIEADKLDTWNAVGQIVVRTDGVTYEGRAQMLDLYSLRYRNVEFMILTKALLLSDTIRKTTTQVTATTPQGKPIDDDAVAELLALLQRELPAEIEKVRATQAAEKKAKAQKDKQKGKKKKKK